MDGRGSCHVRLDSGGTVPPSHHGHDLEHWPLRDTLTLRALADAVPMARAHLRQLLSGWGWAELSPDAGVVVSELVTNAVAASAGLRPAAPVLVWLGSDSYCLLLAVADVSPRPPVRLDLGPDAEGGRGLALVDALSGRWGWYPASVDGLKKYVWAEWRLPDRGRSHDVSGLTDAELERARRDLQVSLALARPGSTACVPMLAHLSAVESELAGRSAGGLR
jgi:anti-sigma regulatory factor (Ser/Thr protein kinase)